MTLPEALKTDHGVYVDYIKRHLSIKDGEHLNDLINTLKEKEPENIRDYIKELGTTSDPARIIQDNVCLLENVKALTRKCKILKLRIDLMSFFVPADKMEKIEKDAEKAQIPR